MTMTLSILRLTNEFVGDYFCHAENELGFDTRAVSVRIRNMPAAHNVSQCCIAQNVSSFCMDACSFYIDIDAVIVSSLTFMRYNLFCHTQTN